MTTTRKTSATWTVWHPVKIVIVSVLLVGATACSAPGPAADDMTQGQGSLTVDGQKASVASSPDSVSAPSESSVPAVDESADSGSDAQQTEAASGEVDEGDQTIAPEDKVPTPVTQPEPALSEDEIKETYGAEEPAPAESMIGTLCNLRQSHLERLSSQIVVNGMVDDQMLRMAALSLSDDLAVWEGLAWQYPNLAAELDSVREIYGHWEFAIGLTDVGDVDGALQELEAAATVIRTLPSEDVAEVGC